MPLDPDNAIAQITARAGMARSATARVGAWGKRWELRDGDPYTEIVEVCHRDPDAESPACLATVTGVIGDGQGAATGIGGANGWAFLCGPEPALISTTPVQADGSGVYTISEEVPCGEGYFLMIYSELDEAFRFQELSELVEGENNLGTYRPNTLGAHGDCPVP